MSSAAMAGASMNGASMNGASAAGMSVMSIAITIAASIAATAIERRWKPDYAYPVIKCQFGDTWRYNAGFPRAASGVRSIWLNSTVSP
jgi:hypothetical protein